MARKRAAIAAAVTAAGWLWLMAGGDAAAQLDGHYLPGFTGLQNGTQPPPGISVSLPVYFYTTNDFRNDAGERFPIHRRIYTCLVVPGVAWVTHVQVLGANLGGSVVPIAVSRSRIEGDSVSDPGKWAFGDIYAQPLQLGWTGKAADFLVGYGLFVPTGRWELGGSDNSGLGMWSQLFQAGTTMHFDDQRKWALSSLVSFETHAHKKDTPIRVGDIVTAEGGLGRSFYTFRAVAEQPVPALITRLGFVYYAQFKVSSDQGGALTPVLGGHRDRVFAAGLESDINVAEPGLAFGLRAEQEFGARNRTQGWTLVFTAGYQLKSFGKRKEEPRHSER